VDEVVTVMLCETPTMTVLSLPSHLMSSDLREVAAVDDRNARYEKVVEAHKISDGGFVSRPTQTMNNPQKNQNEMAAPNALRDFGSQAMSYDIIDATAGLNRRASENELGVGMSTTSTSTGTDADMDDVSGLSSTVKKYVADTVALSSVMPGCMLDVTDLSLPPAPGEARARAEGGRTVGRKGHAGTNAQTSTAASGSERYSGDRDRSSSVALGGGGVAGLSQGTNEDNTAASTAHNSASGSKSNADLDDLSGGGGGTGGGGGSKWGTVDLTEQETLQVIRDKEASNILGSKTLLKRLLMIERAVQQNAYHRQQLDYRDLPDVTPLVFRYFAYNRTMLPYATHPYCFHFLSP
jgi:hypothetical protein